MSRQKLTPEGYPDCPEMRQAAKALLDERKEVIAMMKEYVMGEKPPIRFYTTKDENGYMSNFARYKVSCFGHTWMTSEHAYQAQKFASMNEADYLAVKNALNPAGAAAVGRDPKRTIRPDWNAVRDDVMRFVVFHKFSQNDDIRAKLLATGDRPLFEYDTYRGDQYWAVDAKGVGQNKLGVILMEVREILKEDDLAAMEYNNAVSDCVSCNTLDEGFLCQAHKGFSKPSNIYLTELRF